jgi:CMP-N-acetylneuraminic acid synthetase
MRHDSERVPGKNFRLLAGKPLFEHILDSLLTCGMVDKVVIDTDSTVITQLVNARNDPRAIAIPRPEHLRDGRIPMNQVLLHDIAQVPADYYLQTHSTNPLLKPETIARAVKKFMAVLPTHDSLFGVTRWQTRLYDQHGTPINHDPSQLLRTQDLPPVYEENSNLYLFAPDTLRTLGRRTGERPLLFEIDRLEAVDIDDEDGWVLAEALISRPGKNKETPAKVHA